MFILLPIQSSQRYTTFLALINTLKYKGHTERHEQRHIVVNSATSND